MWKVSSGIPDGRPFRKDSSVCFLRFAFLRPLPVMLSVSPFRKAFTFAVNRMTSSMGTPPNSFASSLKGPRIFVFFMENNSLVLQKLDVSRRWSWEQRSAYTSSALVTSRMGLSVSVYKHRASPHQVFTSL